MDIGAIGRQFGLDEAQTRAALEALAPVVAAGVRRNAQTPEGLQDIFRSVVTDDYDRTLDDEEAIGFDRAKPAGDEVLGRIFGDKDVSRELAEQVSTSSGIGSAALKKLLPIVAMMVMGQLTKQVGGSGAAGSRGDVLSGAQRPMLREPDLTPALRQQGSGNPLEDILSQILGGGGNDERVPQKQLPPGQMGEILKDILGGQFPGTPATRVDLPQHRPSRESVERGRGHLDDVLGAGTRGGTAADDLLRSVENAVRRRRY